MGVDLTIVNATNSTFGEVLFLQTITTNESSDFAHFLPLDFVIMPRPGGYTIFLLIIGPAAVGGGIEGE